AAPRGTGAAAFALERTNHTAVVSPLRRRAGQVGAVPLPAAAGRARDREPSRVGPRRPRGLSRVVRPGTFHQRLPRHVGHHARRIRRHPWELGDHVDSDELAFAGAAQQARMLADGAITAPELLELYLDRIARLDPELRSYRVVLTDSARQEAGLAQDRLNSG